MINKSKTKEKFKNKNQNFNKKSQVFKKNEKSYSIDLSEFKSFIFNNLFLDINECLSLDSCGRGAACQNIPGSYTCNCPPGFTGDAKIECWGKYCLNQF